MIYGYSILILILSLLASSVIHASDDALYAKAVGLKKEKKSEEALAIFRILLGKDSSNVNYLTGTAYLFCKVGTIQPLESNRQNYFRRAEYLATKAIKTDPKNAEAYYTYALALGRMNENASSKQKIANAKTMRTALDKAIELDPLHEGAWHILGRWHRTIASFNAVERLTINTLFGGMPQGGSHDDAIDCFTICYKLEPDFILHAYELAVSYYERNKEKDKIYATVWLKKAREMPIRDAEDKITLSKVEALLAKLN